MNATNAKEATRMISWVFSMLLVNLRSQIMGHGGVLDDLNDIRFICHCRVGERCHREYDELEAQRAKVRFGDVDFKLIPSDFRLCHRPHHGRRFDALKHWMAMAPKEEIRQWTGDTRGQIEVILVQLCWDPVSAYEIIQKIVIVRKSAVIMWA
ncbi:hypothetical protein FPV67DRAFT_1527929 [Lyophyllum atratum]|nr:hypothetical protein FPV67DRAFT_1527929 [Lyophyllum atratum]